MADHLPWFPFDVDRWDTDEAVRLMSLTERGAYITLLCWQWREGSIPADIEKLKRGLSTATAVLGSATLADESLRQLVTDCFEDHPIQSGRLVNPVLWEIAETQRLRSRSKSIAGRKGGLSAARARLQQTSTERDLEEQTELETTEAVSQERQKNKTHLPVPSSAAKGVAVRQAAADRKLHEKALHHAAEIVFVYWRDSMGRDVERTLFGGKREKRLLDRLRENNGNITELLYAVDGAKKDPWLMGTASKSQRKYDDTQHIFRDREQVERLVDLVRGREGQHPYLAENGNGGGE